MTTVVEINEQHWEQEQHDQEQQQNEEYKQQDSLKENINGANTTTIDKNDHSNSDNGDKNEITSPSGETVVADKYIIYDDAVVGRGAWSVAKKCSAIPPYEPPGARPGMNFVVKIIEKKYLISLAKGNVHLAMSEVKREIDTLRHIPPHENIATFLEYIETEEHFLLFFEEVSGGDLCELILKRPTGRLSEEKSKKYIYQLIKAVLHCHLHDVIHRDIKPENLLVSDQDVIKLTDFGLSKRLKGVCTSEAAADPLDMDALAMPLETCERLLHKHITCTDVIGTPRYGAPEMFYAKFTHTTYDGFKADTWSIGVVAYITLTGAFPFAASSSATEEEVFHSIMNTPLIDPADITSDGVDFVQCLLCKDPARRIPLYATLCHPWLNDVMEPRGSVIVAQLRQACALTQETHKMWSAPEIEDMMCRFDAEAQLLHKCMARLQYEIIHLKSNMHNDRSRRNEGKSLNRRSTKREESVDDTHSHHNNNNKQREEANHSATSGNDSNNNNNNESSSIRSRSSRVNHVQNHITRARTPLYNSSLNNSNNNNGRVRNPSASPSSRLRVISPARGALPSSSSSSSQLRSTSSSSPRYGLRSKLLGPNNNNNTKIQSSTCSELTNMSQNNNNNSRDASHFNHSRVTTNNSRDVSMNSVGSQHELNKPNRRSVSTSINNSRSTSHLRGANRVAAGYNRNMNREGTNRINSGSIRSNSNDPSVDRAASRGLSLSRSTPRRISTGLAIRTKSPLSRSAGGMAVRRGTPFRIAGITPIRSTTPSRGMNGIPINGNGNNNRSTSLVRRILSSSLYGVNNSNVNTTATTTNRYQAKRNALANGSLNSSNIHTNENNTNDNVENVNTKENNNKTNNESVCNSSASMNSIHKLLDAPGKAETLSANYLINNINNSNNASNNSSSNYDQNSINATHSIDSVQYTNHNSSNGRGATPTRTNNTTFRSRSSQPASSHHLVNSNLNHNSRASNTNLINMSKLLQVNDHVVYKGCRGVIRYNGPTSFGAGIWIGLEMLEGNEGTNDGSSFIDKKQYFQCPKGKGVFVRASQVRKLQAV